MVTRERKTVISVVLFLVALSLLFVPVLSTEHENGNGATCTDADEDGTDACDSDGNVVSGCDDPCDFDDSDDTSYPGAPELCDGIDNDNDATTDDGSGETAPACALSSGVCSGVTSVCTGGAWVCDYGTDYEEIEATCSDTLDNDCDGDTDLVDSDCVTAACADASATILTPDSFYEGFSSDFGVDYTLSGDETATITYDWDVGGDGTSDYTTEAPSHTYDLVGGYSATVTVGDGVCTATDTKQINVSCGISLSIGELDYSNYPKDYEISFTGTGTHARDAEVTLNWDFGDGGSGSGETAPYSYTSTGDYTITLTGSVVTGTDANGDDVLCTASETSELNIDDGEPHAIITSPAEGNVDVGQQVTFQESSTDLNGNIVKWVWDFGDRSKPWGFSGTSGNLPACYNYENPTIFCAGETEIEWASASFEVDADCTCLDRSDYIYPDSIVEATTSPGLRLYSYSSTDACADYGSSDDSECEVTLTVTDDEGLTSIDSVTLTLAGAAEEAPAEEEEEEEESPDLVCKAKDAKSKSCVEGESDKVFSDGTVDCCCKAGMYLKDVSSTAQAVGKQTKECSSTPPATVKLKKKPAIPKNPVIITTPKKKPTENYVTPKSKEVKHKKDSITSQMAGKSSQSQVPSAQAAAAPSQTPSAPSTPVAPIVSIIIVALLVGLGFAYKKGKLPPQVEEKISDMLDRIPMLHKKLPEEIGAEEEIPPETTAGTVDPLASYVSQAREQGMSAEQIRSVLKAQGWPDDKIDEAMR